MKMDPVSDSYYDGSRIFKWITDYTNISIDLINFTATQITAVLLAPLFRGVLHPKHTSQEVRHGVGLLVGLIMGYFAFGRQAVHLAGLPALCYLVLRTQDPHIFQSLVLAVSMFYLSCIHIHRQIYDYGSLTLDITGPLMVIVQKVTSLAYNLHDGITQEEGLTTTQKYYAIRKMPSTLEYFAYIFHFQVLMAGPVVFYRDYIDYINGDNFLKHTDLSGDNMQAKLMLEPSPTKCVIKKISASVLCALLFVTLVSSFPISKVKEDEFIDRTSVVSQLCYLSIATLLIRFKYYHAWLLADAICNLSGLGFNGYSSDGSPKWDLISNVDVFRFEFGTSLKETIEYWNKGTNVWLRMIVYDRCKNYRTLLTYALSSFWHGFYPGYYLTFAGGALFTFASRAVRHSVIRHSFQTSSAMKNLYDFITMITTRLVVTYITFSFVVLEFWPSFRIYRNMYFSLHLLGVAALLVLPIFPAGTRRQPSPIKDQFTKVASNGLSVGIQG
ncbi:lysophospholipid acyltransferase 6-like [Macrosteles quadrilineatus]|uniref:lysophospholipid acyltransferase 6-like n=1 Tax=Macrosteles quadrilineatus TaxID=74068 RepID=UPI0023E2CFEF|nr:lysophospholipid acyltransferase 6-like [Macrosteles quadrilineatus]